MHRHLFTSVLAGHPDGPRSRQVHRILAISAGAELHIAALTTQHASSSAPKRSRVVSDTTRCQTPSGGKDRLRSVFQPHAASAWSTSSGRSRISWVSLGVHIRGLRTPSVSALLCYRVNEPPHFSHLRWLSPYSIRGQVPLILSRYRDHSPQVDSSQETRLSKRCV